MSDRKTDYTNDAQQRILNMVRILAGNEFSGLLPSEIAKAMNVSPAIVTRDLFNLEAVGFAGQLPDTGRWRLGATVMQVAVAFLKHIDQQQIRLDELKNRYTRLP